VNDTQKDGLKDAIALLHAADREDDAGFRVIFENCAPVDTTLALCALALGFAHAAGMSFEHYAQFALANLNETQDGGN
jgi:hypothetical protein